MQEGNKLSRGGQVFEGRHPLGYNRVRQATRLADRLHVGHHGEIKLEGEYVNFMLVFI